MTQTKNIKIIKITICVREGDHICWLCTFRVCVRARACVRVREHACGCASMHVGVHTRSRAHTKCG